MKPIHAAYTQEVYANLRPLHATWEPTQPLKIGDIGVLQGRAFRQQTHLDALLIEFSERRGGARPNLWFGSHGTTEIELKPEVVAAAGVLPQRASLELSFNSEGAVFFHAAQCESVFISDKKTLGRAVIDRFKRSDWDQKWVVVTEVVKAAATTIVISGQSDATLKLEAQATVPSLDLAESNLRFQVRSVARVDYQLISSNGLTPLIGLSKLQRSWFHQPEFGPSLAESEESDTAWRFVEIA